MNYESASREELITEIERLNRMLLNQSPSATQPEAGKLPIPLAEKINSVLDSVEDPIWGVDSCSRMILFNRAYAAVFRELYCVDPCLGATIDELIPAARFPHSNSYWNDYFKHSMTREICQHEYSFAASGKLVHYLISSYPLTLDTGTSGLLVVARDVTRQREYEERAYEISEFNNRIFEASPIGIVTFDSAGRCVSANKASSCIFGAPYEEMLQGGYFELPIWKENGLFETAKNSLNEGHETRTIVNIMTLGERNAWLDCRFIPFVSSGEKHLLSLITDITESRQIEEDAVSIMHELKQSNAELERFAYVASHDLQEPLRVIASYLQLIERRYADKLDDKGRDFIARTVSAAKRMQNMIEDLLAYSRVMTKGGVFEPVSLGDAFSDALNNLAVTIKKSKAEIMSMPLPPVIADRSQMTRLFQNLIGNAIKFCKKERPVISVSCENAKNEWIVSIKDNGIGISEEFYPRIFQVFQRLHTRDEYSGSGIGLAVCQRITERHGGRIWVSSAPGDGSTFYFSIPKEKTGNGRS